MWSPFCLGGDDGNDDGVVCTSAAILPSIGFDRYYKSLRPRLKPEHCTQTGVNQRHPTDPSLWINCRNIWFNEFWSQHHKCSFEPAAKIPCTGDEKLTNYEQEGLVPFVGEWFIFDSLLGHLYRNIRSSVAALSLHATPAITIMIAIII